MNPKEWFMRRISMTCFVLGIAGLIMFSLSGTLRTVHAQNPTAEKVIYNFSPATGYSPTGVIRDTAGNLYVAASLGGGNQACDDGCGSIISLSPSGQPTVLYDFTYTGIAKSGPGPTGLVRDAQGNIYTATSSGGRFLSYGAVFKLTPSGNAGLLHSFDANGEDGYNPSGGMTRDSSGNLYGSTLYGGGTGCGGAGCGTVYRVTRSGVETILHSFAGSDGSFPEAAPILDQAGNLYGTAVLGGHSCPN